MCRTGRLQISSVTLPPPMGSGAGLTTSYGYDGDGRQDSVTDAMNHTTSTSFTADGEVSQTKDNLNNITSYAYGHLGELLSTTDPLSHAESDLYDSRFRLVQTTDANGGITSITLDPAGNEIKLVDPDNNSTSWTFDALNRPVTEANALGTTTTTYDASSDVTSIQDADGRVRDFIYDNLHRLTAEKWMNGNTVVATMSYGYDLANELTSASDPNSAYAFAYDGDGNVLTVDNNGTPNVPHVVLTNTFDLMGDRTSQSASIVGTLDYLNNYSYDADQRLTMVQQQGQSGGNVVAPKEVDLGYNALGQYTSVVYYNSLTTPRTDVATGAYTYDGDNRLTGLAYTSNAGANKIDTFGWTYNNASLVSTFTDNDGTASYGYDPTNQLTSATYTTNSGGHQPANESYSFDLNGNRNSTGYTTAADNLMTSDGTFNYQHDADGNQTVRTRISDSYAPDYETIYSWDYRNRLTDVEYFDNNNVLTKHVHFVYGVFDHLIATEVDTTGGGSYNQVEYYVLNVSPETPQAGVPGMALAQPVLMFDANGNATERLLEAVDRIFAEGSVSSPTVADTVNWDVVDNLGSLRDVLNNNGGVIDHDVYKSFGQMAYESNPSVEHFTGFARSHVDLTTGLFNEYHRWGDAATGRWLSQDPASFSGGDTNLSRYVGNDSQSALDAAGLAVFGPSPQWATVSIAIGSGTVTNSSGAFLGTGLGQVGTVEIEGILKAAWSRWLWGWRGNSGPASNITIAAVPLVPNPTAPPPPTSVYSLMVEQDPNLPAKIAAAQQEMHELADDYVSFLATTPFVAMPVDPNKLNHVFGNPKHNLGPLQQSFGGNNTAAYQAVQAAAQQAAMQAGYANGTVVSVSITVNGIPVTVTGIMINGTLHLGTFFS